MAGKTLSFGVGTVYADDVPFGIIQNVNLSITASIKELYGENIFPEAIGVGTHKVSGTATFAKWNTELLPKYMFGTTMESGNQQRFEEAVGVPAVTPYTVTVDEASDFSRNISVVDVETGQHLKLVASAPSSGQYTVTSAGVYTFNAAQSGKGLIISYDADVDNGQHFVMKQRRMGQQYPFTMTLANEFQGKQYAFTLYSCVLTKSDWAFKNDDFAVPNVDFSCFVNDAGLLGRFDFSDKV